jgi:hypothetical protein
MRSNLGRQSDGRQDLELVRDIVRSRLRFLFCVIRVQLARSEWTLAGGLMCLVGRSRLIKINNGDKINNYTCERATRQQYSPPRVQPEDHTDIFIRHRSALGLPGTPSAGS